MTESEEHSAKKLTELLPSNILSEMEMDTESSQNYIDNDTEDEEHIDVSISPLYSFVLEPCLHSST